MKCVALTTVCAEIPCNKQSHAIVYCCRCIDALVTMGVLVPGGDRTAVRRTAEFFLKNFEVRLQ